MIRITKESINNVATIYITDEFKYHNPHGPAIKYENGEKTYYQNNKEQNVVGPCRLCKDGSSVYSINGGYL